jgi:acyl-CoA reductase-like NAD-dependent aldehyde dehydrogenase
MSRPPWPPSSKETFAPVLTLSTVNADDEASSQANNSDYFMVASVFSKDTMWVMHAGDACCQMDPNG